MRRLLLPLLAGVLAVVLLVGCVPGPPESQEAIDGPRAGGRLPDVRLDALEGEGGLDLAELRGPAVVNLWASWCGPCKEELPYYQSFAEQYAGSVDVVGVAWKDPDTDGARTLAADAGLTYPLYTDPDGDLQAATGLPQLVLIDAQGEVALQQGVLIDSVEELESLVEEHLGPVA